MYFTSGVFICDLFVFSANPAWICLREDVVSSDDEQVHDSADAEFKTPQFEQYQVGAGRTMVGTEPKNSSFNKNVMVANLLLAR